MNILVTGATGKVGQTFIQRFLSGQNEGTIRAFCHNRVVEETDRVSIVKGDISNRSDVQKAMDGITHVVHLATCKETPDDVMDVTVKGLFWLLEEARECDIFKQFILIGGDAAMGHFIYPYDIPVTEQHPFRPYQGCYALSKVLEECMLEQYYTQYDLNGCCLRAPWIMEKDDFKYTLTFTKDVFGGPRWCDLVDPGQAKEYAETETVPLLRDPDGNPVKLNFVHVEDLVSAILKAIDHPKAKQQLFHVCMDEPVDYGEVATYLNKTRNLPSVNIDSKFHSTWLDNTKTKLLLDWRPKYDLAKLIDSSWDYARSADDVRKILYPG